MREKGTSVISAGILFAATAAVVFPPRAGNLLEPVGTCTQQTRGWRAAAAQIAGRVRADGSATVIAAAATPLGVDAPCIVHPPLHPPLRGGADRAAGVQRTAATDTTSPRWRRRLRGDRQTSPFGSRGRRRARPCPRRRGV